MEKILLVVNDEDIQESTIRFACFIAKLTSSTLTAILPEELLIEEEVVINEAEGMPYVESISISEIPDNTEKVNQREESIRIFQELAKEAEIQSFVHVDKGLPAEEIIEESRFTDLLIIDTATSFADFIKDILQKVWCPVLIAPPGFTGIDNIIFIYDKGKSSVFAIKQFTYLFPELKSQKAKIVYINHDELLTEEEELQVIDWLQYHYAGVEFIIPKADAVQAYFNYLFEKKNDLVVMGGYGHGLLASFFVNNQADGTSANELPIFVSHY